MTEQKVSLCFYSSVAFLNTLTMGTPFPCVPAAFQQWERRSHAFPLEMTPDVLGDQKSVPEHSVIRA